MMKQLLTILFILITAGAKSQYLIVSSEDKAKAISKKFYQLSRPNNEGDVTEYLFEWINNDSTGQSAVYIDTSVSIPRGNITLAQVDNWINQIYGTSLTDSQKNAIKNYINTHPIIYVRDIIVSGILTLVSYDYLIENGWIKY